jgi:hypothetical protein
VVFLDQPPTAHIWVVCALFVLVAPPAAFVPALVVVGLTLVGGVYFAYMMEIADPAGAGVGTFYRGFPDRAGPDWSVTARRHLDLFIRGLRMDGSA